MVWPKIGNLYAFPHSYLSICLLAFFFERFRNQDVISDIENNMAIGKKFSFSSQSLHNGVMVCVNIYSRLTSFRLIINPFVFLGATQLEELSGKNDAPLQQSSSFSRMLLHRSNMRATHSWDPRFPNNIDAQCSDSRLDRGLG
jgi:hypothetical protein